LEGSPLEEGGLVGAILGSKMRFHSLVNRYIMGNGLSTPPHGPAKEEANDTKKPVPGNSEQKDGKQLHGPRRSILN